jgi:hypothetical protein
MILLLGDFYMLAVAFGDVPRAVRLAAAADHHASARGTELATVVSMVDWSSADSSSLDPDIVTAETEKGRTMSLEEAVADALQTAEPEKARARS